MVPTIQELHNPSLHSEHILWFTQAFSKDPWTEGWVPSLYCLGEVTQPSEMKPGRRKLGYWECDRIGTLGPGPFLSLVSLPVYNEIDRFLCHIFPSWYTIYSIMVYSNGTTWPWTKMFKTMSQNDSFSLSWLLQGFCHNNGKLVNTQPLQEWGNT